MEKKLKEEIVELKKEEDNIRAKRQRIESQLFEMTAKRIKKEIEEKGDQRD